MYKMHGPTRLMQVGAAFVIIIMFLAASAMDPKSASQKSMNGLDQYYLDTSDLRLKPPSGHLGDGTMFPVSSLASSPIDQMGSESAFKYRMTADAVTNGSNKDNSNLNLTTIDSVAKSDLFDVGVNDIDQKNSSIENYFSMESMGRGLIRKAHARADQNEDLEKYVDSVIASIGNHKNYNNYKKSPRDSIPFGNEMNIDVRGITVSAINTVEDGNAAATSTIIIEPVQKIVCSSEAQEKLK